MKGLIKEINAIKELEFTTKAICYRALEAVNDYKEFSQNPKYAQQLKPYEKWIRIFQELAEARLAEMN